ncbi:sterol desaturase family protein [Pseudokordiimonas caeni]|uniref:sterol desaturase family protein n=1 Tax=Pseudokordiimonas caeni TaxID=2997908 RepID=UPI002810E50E|nr:sterol desaturase family protein [Pseudokordiimonas caeni]
MDLMIAGWERLEGATLDLLMAACFFVPLGLLLNRRTLRAGLAPLREETRFNLTVFILDILFVTPLIAVLLYRMRLAMPEGMVPGLAPETYTLIGIPLTAFLAIFIGDMTSYFRHRLEHSRLLWPAHVMHHSDRAMTFLAIFRFHPVNRLTTALIDGFVLAALGFPAWAVVANSLVRHYYGMFIHADLPWTYGPLGRFFVSPAMHRWHHVREGEGVGSNFATVFSIFDQLFGTYYVPGPCRDPLGVTEAAGKGVSGQLAHPFKTWGRALAVRRPKEV